jgi:hypothetical protein
MGLLVSTGLLRGEVTTTVEHNDNDHATSAFTFKTIPKPPRASGTERPRFVIVDGQADPNGGGPGVLNDGRLANEADAPAQNFFFQAGTEGGRLMLDLGSSNELREINTISWHPDTRAPQVYFLYASDGLAADFKKDPKRPTDPATVGWKLITKIDTRPKTEDSGGQYAVRISDTSGKLGSFRYLLFDISPTETRDAFGNTFYSEIDVVTAGQPVRTAAEQADCTDTLDIDHGAYRVLVDTCETADLRQWTRIALDPVIREWYPKIVALLPSDGFTAPKELSVRFSESMRGVAATGGTRVTCAAQWFRANLQGEAVGSVVHELVHVVQQYGRARRTNPNARRSPGWLVEGLADYVRWFLYEPQSHGADVAWLRQRRNPQLRYDAGYRITANFLNWVTEKYDKELIPYLNAAMREGNYTDELWQQRTGHSLSDLGEQWKREVSEQLESGAPAQHP